MSIQSFAGCVLALGLLLALAACAPAYYPPPPYYPAPYAHRVYPPPLAGYPNAQGQSTSGAESAQAGGNWVNPEPVR